MIVRAAFAVAASMIAAPSSAAIIYTESGVLTPGEQYLEFRPFDPGRTYRFALTFSRPATSVTAGFVHQLDYLCFEGGQGYQEIFECGIAFFYDEGFSGANVTSLTFQQTAPDGFSDVFRDVDGFLYGTQGFVTDLYSGFNVTFGSGADIGYSFVLSQSVPEPATWAMLITGFGLLGGALRARRQRQMA